VQPRWGKIGKQKIEDAGELCPKRMETLTTRSCERLKFVDKARQDNKPFFLWLNPPDACRTHLSEKYENDAHRENGWSIRKPAWRNSTTSSARS
jgi:arylsulfatase